MPRTLLKLALVLGCVVLATGVLGAVASISNSVPGTGGGWRPAWFMFGFELVVCLAGVLCILLGRGKFGSPALGLLCAGGAVAVATLFGYLGAGGVVWGVGLKPLLAGRAGLGLCLAALAGAVQLQASPGNTKLLIRGVVLAIPALGLPLAAWTLRTATANWPEILRLSILMVGFVVVIGLIAASADCLIRAFAPKTERAGGAEA